ncbi:MAG: TssQ family T6SS-associated lipoprotein [Betaproteobacteria bacterium]|jgi:Tfp pilus assembly protein PilF|nr:TssQ family T6SS-associated lipoprotein [Betaproteobacteria bacterium]MDH4294265.1 TssQ family T6SS-associated lipoprotein [Betaproteobacteria bacterium]MDH5343266.1 TssQ family T6SS-associated lipoprotein [Betaproteobacteria bacterium]
MRLIFILLFLAPLLTACETVKQSAQYVADSFDFDKARAKTQENALPTPEARLKSGIAQYESGNYGEAQRLLQASLAEGLSRPDQAIAYKHLAFIYCVTERPAQCRQEFNNALSADPKFTLTAAEAGHPSWGPVFRSVSRGR